MPYLTPFTHNLMVSGLISMLVPIALNLVTRSFSKEQPARVKISGTTFAGEEKVAQFYIDFSLCLGLGLMNAATLWIPPGI